MIDIDQNRINLLRTMLGLCDVDLIAKKTHETNTHCQFILSLKSRSRQRGKFWFSMTDNPLGMGAETELILDIPKADDSEVAVYRTLLDTMMLGKIDGIYRNDTREDRTTCLLKIPRFESLNELKLKLDLMEGTYHA